MPRSVAVTISPGFDVTPYMDKIKELVEKKFEFWAIVLEPYAYLPGNHMHLALIFKHDCLKPVSNATKWFKNTVLSNLIKENMCWNAMKTMDVWIKCKTWYKCVDGKKSWVDTYMSKKNKPISNFESDSPGIQELLSDNVPENERRCNHTYRHCKLLDDLMDKHNLEWDNSMNNLQQIYHYLCYSLREVEAPMDNRRRNMLVKQWYEYKAYHGKPLEDMPMNSDGPDNNARVMKKQKTCMDDPVWVEFGVNPRDPYGDRGSGI